MVIVRQWAGLGNQMFIYAYYRALQNLGKETKIDISYFDKFEVHGGKYKIPEVFGNSVNIYATSCECGKYANYKMAIFHRFMRKIGLDKKTHIIQTSLYHDYGYVPELMNIEQGYIDGYFQSEKYFCGIQEQIRKEFEFTIVPKKYPNEFKDLVRSCNSVSVHIRRGDYTATGSELLCDTKYYDNAIRYMNNHVTSPIYFIFSDDILWCKSYFRNITEKIVFVEGQPEAYLDLYLMTQCKHNIIADSSFSWWGAWLNNNKDKIVCAPQNWLISGKFATSNIIPDAWKKISLD